MNNASLKNKNNKVYNELLECEIFLMPRINSSHIRRDSIKQKISVT